MLQNVNLMPLTCEMYGILRHIRDGSWHLIKCILEQFTWYTKDCYSYIPFNTATAQHCNQSLRYMATEIGARNFGDTYRYNMLPVCISRFLPWEVSQSRRKFKKFRSFLIWAFFQRHLAAIKCGKLLYEITVFPVINHSEIRLALNTIPVQWSIY